jgi:hypothetical protein
MARNSFNVNSSGKANSTPVLVVRTNDRKRYLTFQSAISVSPEHLVVVEQLSPEVHDNLLRDISLKLAAIPIGYRFVAPPLKQILVAKSVPITNSLTEDAFFEYLDRMDAAVQIAKGAFVLSLAGTGVRMPTLPAPVTKQQP